MKGGLIVDLQKTWMLELRGAWLRHGASHLPALWPSLHRFVGNAFFILPAFGFADRDEVESFVGSCMIISTHLAHEVH